MKSSVRSLLQKNQKGGALLNSLIVSTVVVVTSGVIYQQSLNTQRLNKYPRIKSTELTAETAIKTWALQPSSYTNCGTGSANCNINLETLGTRAVFPVPGAQCPEGTPNCGFRVQNISFNPASAEFRAELVYQGTEVSLKPKVITMTIPPETLHTDVVLCDAATPIFRGFNADGTPICSALPASRLCPTGQYAREIDLGRLAVACENIALSGTCAANEVIDSITWNNGRFDITCAPRMNAFAYPNPTPFTPTIVANGGQDNSDILPRPQDAIHPGDYFEYGSCGATGPPPTNQQGSAQCGSAHGGAPTNTPPATDLCVAPATPSAVNSLPDDKHTWTCTTTTPPDTAQCERLKDEWIVGRCGSLNGNTAITRTDFETSLPSARCDRGQYDNFGNNNNVLTWQCKGNPAVLNTANCSAPEKILGVCSLSGSMSSASFNSGTKCNPGTATDVPNPLPASGSVSYKCQGINTQASEDPSCSVTLTNDRIDGVCNNNVPASTTQPSATPSTNLCSAGQPNNIQPTGTGTNLTWTWTCTGQNGGSNPTCSSVRTCPDGQVGNASGVCELPPCPAGEYRNPNTQSCVAPPPSNIGLCYCSYFNQLWPSSACCESGSYTVPEGWTCRRANTLDGFHWLPDNVLFLQRTNPNVVIVNEQCQ
jgi:hypothetical protein